TQNNLAAAYSNRIRGEKAENIELAIKSYTAALTIRTRDAFPQDWAMTQNNLAAAYSNRIRGEKADNIELAIASYTAALTIRTPDAFPEQWATTQNNLAIAYRNRIRGEKADNIELAIKSYTAALTIRTPDAFPQDWAGTQNNLANAYSNRIRGEKAENIELATKCYRQALEIYTPSAFPLDCLKAGRNLGNFAFEIEDWENAIYGYENAITAAEQSREWATSQRSKRKILENALPMYEKMVLACIHLQRYETALLTIERSKSRTLIELLDNANLYPKNSTPAQKQQLSQLRRQIASLQQQLDIDETPTETETTTETNTDPLKEKGSISTAKSPQTSDSHLESQLKTLQQQVTQLLRKINDPDFNLTQRVIPQLPDFTQFLDSQTALIEWYLPPNPDSGFHVFIVTNRAGSLPVPPLNKGGLGGVPTHIHHIPFTPEQHQQLNTDIATYLSDYGKPTWGEALSHRLVTLAASLQLNQTLAALPPTIEKLILIPHRDLHLLPLHALQATRKLPNGETKTDYWLDLYTNGIQYSPSSQFLERLHQRKRPPLKDILPLFAIQNPTEDLRYTEIEVEEISRRFNPNAHILKRQEATKIAFNSAATLQKLSDSYYAHFSCHGSFNSENPLNSGLVFAGILEPPQPPLLRGEEEGEEPSQAGAGTGAPPLPKQEEDKDRCDYVTLRDGRRFRTDIQCLTLKEIFASLDLPLCRLVSLSACETGLVKRLITDEYIGLASGFLYAGASNVVSSLWRVSDFSTAFLMIRFYQNLNNQDLSVCQALQGAQVWLRTITRKDFLAWLTDEVKIPEDRVDEVEFLLLSDFPNQPFADPRYWAAFCAIGI
ncbi:CHAT domain-containing protein, partial [Tychonema sp. BBK16]